MFRSSRFRPAQAQAENGTETPPEPPRVAAASLVLIGLVLGLAGGLVYAWLINPVVFVDAGPDRLNAAYQDEYIFLVSQSYAASGDWEKAEARLRALDDPNVDQRVAALFEQYLREAQRPDYVRNLAYLTQAAGGESAALALFGPTPLPPPITPSPTAPATATPTPLPTATGTRRPTNTPEPSPTPAPSVTASPTPPPVYRLLSQDRLCPAGSPAPRIEIEVFDADLIPLPGVEIIVSWDEGNDRFFTGFKPDQSLGYADFTMQPGVSYSVVLAEGSPEISGLRVETCDSGLDGGWRLEFQNLVVSQATATPTPEN